MRIYAGFGAEGVANWSYRFLGHCTDGLRTCYVSRSLPILLSSDRYNTLLIRECSLLDRSILFLTGIALTGYVRGFLFIVWQRIGLQVGRQL